MNNTALSADQPRGRAWLATGALGISAFAIVTSELAPVGMLQALAQTFQQTAAQTGQVVTVYGWVAALAALLSVALPARISRKTLLVTLMLLLALASLAAAQAPGFPLFMAARLAGAIAHGVFWALIGSVAVQLVPAEKLGRATAVIFGGVSAASVLGVPLASYLAAVTGWREAFTVISLLALVTACALLRTLPALAPSAAQPLRSCGPLLKNPRLLAVYAATACIISAHFAAFTYVEPLLRDVRHVPAAMIAALLLVSGLAGLAGNVIAGRLIDRHLKPLVCFALLTGAAALGTLALSFAMPLWLTGALLAVWRAGMAIVFVGLQTLLLRRAGAQTAAASALYVAVFNAAIGSGALAGGALLTMIGLPHMVLLAAVIIAAAIALL